MGNKYRSRNRQRKVLQPDRISVLPDEILIMILSFMNVKDAARTSILASRWRYLWLSSTGSFNFDFTGRELLQRMSTRMMTNCNLTENPNHRMVNEVLRQHCGPYINEFSVVGLVSPHPCCTCVDNWISYAIKKGVQKFELDFGAGVGTLINNHYPFPSVERLVDLLDSEGMKSLNQLHDLRGVTSSGHNLHSFCCLKSLSLRNIHVSEEVLHFFMSNCLSLECLCVERARLLVNLKVVGPRLKHLELTYCWSLKTLEIYAENLESFIYDGPRINVPFRKVPPQLLELTAGPKYSEWFVLDFHEHLIYLSQLKSLKLVIFPDVDTLIFRTVRRGFPEMINLKHLEVNVVTTFCKELLRYMTFVKASPFLSTFKLKYHLHCPPECSWEYQRRVFRGSNDYHQFLEEVTLDGFAALPSDICLASELLRVAVALKKMILQFEGETTPRAMSLVQVLAAKLPKGAKIVVKENDLALLQS